MKNIFYLVIVLLYSCNSSPSIEPTVADSVLKECIQKTKWYSESYDPTRKPNEAVPKLPSPPDSIIKAFAILKANRPDEYEQHLTLIFIKIYSAHLECCHQGYDLQKTNSQLLFAFNELTNYYSNTQPEEFIGSHYGYEYVKANLHLLENKEIKKQFDIIQQIGTNIKNEVYWEK